MILVEWIVSGLTKIFQVSLKIYLHFKDKPKSWSFGTSWGRVNDESVFIFGWTKLLTEKSPFHHNSEILHFCMFKLGTSRRNVTVLTLTAGFLSNYFNANFANLNGNTWYVHKLNMDGSMWFMRNLHLKKVKYFAGFTSNDTKWHWFLHVS